MNRDIYQNALIIICLKFKKILSYLHRWYRWSHSVLHFYIWQPVVATTRLKEYYKELNAVLELLFKFIVYLRFKNMFTSSTWCINIMFQQWMWSPKCICIIGSCTSLSFRNKSNFLSCSNHQPFFVWTYDYCVIHFICIHI